MKVPSLLVVEDDDDFFEIIERIMLGMTARRHLTYHIRRARTLSQARGLLTSDLDLAVFDACVDGDGNTPDSMEVVEEFKKVRPELPIVGMSACSDNLRLLTQAGCNSAYDKMNLQGLFSDVMEKLFGEAKAV